MRFPPLWQQANSYPSQLDRSLFATLWPRGGVQGGAVTAVANTMNLSIAPGSVAVPLQSGQGGALCRWDAAEVVTLDAAPPSGQTRWDVLVCQVRDNQIDSGPINDWIFAIVKGTPSDSNAVIPPTPPNDLALANVTVPGAAANLNSAVIFDIRPGGLAVSPAASDIQSGRGGYQVDASGNIRVGFYRAFVGVPSICLAVPMWTGSPVVSCVLLEANLSGAGASFTCRTATNTQAPNGTAVSVQWLAVYYPT